MYFKSPAFDVCIVCCVTVGFTDIAQNLISRPLATGGLAAAFAATFPSQR